MDPCRSVSEAFIVNWGITMTKAKQLDLLNIRNQAAKGFRKAMLPAAILGLSLAAPVSMAQQLEEIIVTAQKRAQGLQDVPISVSAVSGGKMEEAGITNMEGLAAYVPNFSINQTGISTTITIRGINSGINQGFEQSVGMYVDGIYYGRAQLARAPLFDVERVEVLRGPQGILFGKNSIAGAVSVVTAKPTDEFEGSVTAMYEPDHGEQDFRLIVSGGLTDNLFGRLAIMDRTMDGFMTNSTLNRDEPEQEEQVIRGTLVWETDAATATFKYEHSTFDVKGRNIEVFLDTAGETGFGLSTVFPAITGGTTLDATNDFRRQANGDLSENEVDNAVLTVEYAIGENTLTSVTGYSAYEYVESCDCDYTSAPTFILGLDEDFDQFSQEIRLTSPEGETIDYIVGAFYQTADLFFHDNFQTTPLSALSGLSPSLGGVSVERNFDQSSDLWAAFAQVTWNISDRLRLTLGGRYTDESKEASRVLFSDTTGPNGTLFGPYDFLDAALNQLRVEDHSVAGSRDETAFTPLINFQADVTDDMMVYAIFTSGFKAGGFDVRSNASPDPTVGLPSAITTGAGLLPSPVGVFEFEEEEADSFEIGAKMGLLDGAAELNVALYRTDYKDLQVSIFDGGLGFNVGNAAEAKVQGIEMDGRWAVSDPLTLSASFAYLDFEFEDYDNGECYFRQAEFEPSTVTNAVLDMCSYDGKRQAYTPEITASLSGDYVTMISDNLEFRTVIDLNYSDDYFASTALDPRAVQDSFVKVNARISIADAEGSWELALLGKNLTDEKVLTYAAEVPASSLLVSQATGGAGQGLAYYGFFDRPRTIALQATYRF